MLKTFQAVESEEIKVEVCVFLFDLLFLDGESLVQRPFRIRRQLLREKLPPPIEGSIGFAESLVTSDTDNISEFLDNAVKGRYSANSLTIDM